MFLATTSITDDLKLFVRRHTTLLEFLPIWTVRLVMPPYVSGVRSLLESVVRDVLATAHSAAILDALASGQGTIESEVLPLSYRHLSPLTRLVRPVRSGVKEGEREGEQAPARPQPPQVEYDVDDPAGCARDWQRLVNAPLGES